MLYTGLKRWPLGFLTQPLIVTSLNEELHHSKHYVTQLSFLLVSWLLWLPEMHNYNTLLLVVITYWHKELMTSCFTGTSSQLFSNILHARFCCGYQCNKAQWPHPSTPISDPGSCQMWNRFEREGKLPFNHTFNNRKLEFLNLVLSVIQHFTVTQYFSGLW